MPRLISFRPIKGCSIETSMFLCFSLKSVRHLSPGWIILSCRKEILWRSIYFHNILIRVTFIGIIIRFIAYILQSRNVIIGLFLHGWLIVLLCGWLIIEHNMYACSVLASRDWWRYPLDDVGTQFLQNQIFIRMAYKSPDYWSDFEFACTRKKISTYCHVTVLINLNYK